MKSTSLFRKVSLEQFKKDWKKNFPEDVENDEYIEEIYNSIKLPERGSLKSAGYDFFLPEAISMDIGTAMVIPTGIRCVNMEYDTVLKVYPRSGLGTKHGFILVNTVGIIDADYSDSNNEGHIFIKMTNNGDDEIELARGKAFCQGMLSTYLTTADDKASGNRNGGFGSTNK